MKTKRNLLKRTLILALVILAIGSVLVFYRKNNNIEHILKTFSVEGLQKDRDEFLRVHQQYISLLNQMKSKIKTLNLKMEEKKRMAYTMQQVGDLYKESNYLDLALKNYKIGISIFPRDAYLNYKIAQVLANLALIQATSKQELFLKKANFFYLRALNLKPKIKKIDYSLGLFYLSNYEKGYHIGSLKQALIHTYRYIEHTKDVKGYFLEARIFYAQNKKREAISAYQTILNMVKPSSEAYKQAMLNIKQLEM